MWRPDWTPVWQLDPLATFFFCYSNDNIFSWVYSKLKSNDFLFKKILLPIDFHFHLLSVAMRQKHLSFTHCNSFDIHHFLFRYRWLLLQVPIHHIKQFIFLSIVLVFKICSTHTSQMPNKLINWAQVNKRTHTFTRCSLLLKHIYGFVSNDPSD